MTTRDQILAEVNKSLALARIKFPSYANAPTPSVQFFSKGSGAGWAKGFFQLAYNEHILSQNETMMRDTVSHEVAHIVCAYTGLGKNHNQGWKRVHRMLGGNGERCYNHISEGIVPQMARVQRKYEHRATCGTFIQLSTCMHKKVMGGLTSRIIRRTGGYINRTTFTGKVI